MSFYTRMLPFFLKNNYYLSLCCIIKDENKYLKEWMEYHLMIGVEHFFIYDNGSKISITETLVKLNLLQYATVIDFPGKIMQIKAYNQCIKKFRFLSNWIGFVDIDEFIVPKNSTNNLALFLKEYESYGGLGINWLLFGSSGNVKKTGKPQLESFLLRANNNFSVNRHIKSIVQPKFVKRAINPHCFKYYFNKKCVNENFMPIENAFSDLSIDKIQLNHYYCRSFEEYEEKILRGRSDANITRTKEDFQYHDKDSNEVEDTTICDIIKSKNNL